MSSVCKLSRFKSELKYFIIVLNDIPVLQPQPQWIKVVFIVKNHSIQIKLKTILEWFLMKNDFFHFLISGHSIFEWAIAGLSFFFKNGPNPASFSLFSSFQYTVDSEQMFNVNKFLPMTALLYQLSHNHHLSFFIFHLFSTFNRKSIAQTKFAIGRIWTRVLLCWKESLRQLRHTH